MEQDRPSEQALVAAARLGDGDAFARLVETHHPALVRYLTSQTGDRELAEDLAQESFIDAFRNMDCLTEDRPFAAWLYRIAQNNLRAAIRRRCRYRFASLDELLERGGEADSAFQEPDVLASVPEREAIRQALDGLSPELRAALRHSLTGLTAREVGAILGISLAAAERRISRAHHRFRSLYHASPDDAVAPPPQRRSYAAPDGIGRTGFPLPLSGPDAALGMMKAGSTFRLILSLGR